VQRYFKKIRILIMYKDINEVKDNIQNLIEDYQQAALGTHRGAYPEVSKVTPVIEEGVIYLLLSDLSRHTDNIKRNPIVTLYFADKNKNRTQMNNPRLTLYGVLERVEKTEEALKKFDKRDKGATMYGQFSDFNIWRFTEDDRMYIAGFGKAYK